MAIRINDEAPDFTAETTEGKLSFHDWKGDSWAVLFSHPKDFTPVCTTELGAVAGLKPEFDKRNVKVIGLSVDPVDSHNSWKGDIADVTGNELNFPLIADPSHEIAEAYEMLLASAGTTLADVLTAKHSVATPADWNQGEDVIIAPAVSDEDAKAKFGSYDAKKPYLRVTKQPS